MDSWYPEMNEDATEDVNFVALMIILHEERVALGDMLGEVPRKTLVKDLGERTEDRRDYARLNVGPDTSLGLNGQSR